MRGINRPLRWEIEDQMKLHGYSLNQVAELAGINAGNLSRALNGVARSITIGQLDALAMIFGKAPGWLYELYIEECMSEEKWSRRRLIPYLVRCAELDRHDCIEPVIFKLLDNPKNVSIIFAVAEQLFQTERLREAEHFYQVVIDGTKDSFSEMLAVSHYRLFLIAQGTDAEKNWRAIIRFEPFRKRLPEHHQLAALMKLTKACFALQKWDEVEKFANELAELSMALCSTREKIESERHLVCYYGAGLLFKGAALEKRGLYDQSKKYVRGYANLEWPEPLDEEGQKEVEMFKIWGKANLYTLEVLTGNEYIIDQYADYLENINRLTDILAGLITILKSANTYGFSVDHVLSRFSEATHAFHSFDDDLILSDRHLRFRYHKAMYEFRHGRIEEGLDETLHCLSLAHKMSRNEDYVRCTALFEQYKAYASEQQTESFLKYPVRAV
ncbi:helix-turn-helix domain-containing protein [Paenibacillus oleatilyticus]|uniref:helix-turn-helix domain-containing protein n=1 Tax=Paenibacillus oleatilyticus TaxID=2594886 RepID=UPI001C1F1F6E|nr:helix-turn-helix transcriptional regulator [Paenibacillus oleatilyticus]MBU7319317.1 helix-turn-helix transcriptional regulator [Paenibacillus oleatilyticus]